MLFYYRLLFLFLGGIAIFIFHRKALLYNKQQEYSIIWAKKDIRPFRILWGIWLILLIFSLLPRFNLPKFPSIHWWNDWNKNIIKDNEEKNNTNPKPIYRQIIDQQRQSELSWNKKAIINPITSWYYELITEDKKLIQSGWIAEWDYPIPQPINISYCKAEDKYRNLLSKNGLHYNWFIYEYLNSNKKKDIVIWVLDTWISKWNSKLKAHILWSGKNVINQNDEVEDSLWHWSHIAWIILQMFPNARILPIKVSEDYSENVYRTDLIAWLRYAIDQNVDIINMSFWWLEKDPVTDQLINEAVNKWILVIAAAWNESQDVTLYYPASYWWVVSVGSIWKTWKSDFSNYWADVQMPWECIYSTYAWWSFAFMDWTSMSAPHLAWIIWSYMSLDNKVSKESEIIGIINKNLEISGWNSLLNIQKLLWIEDKNNSFYGNLWNIKNILEEINKKLTTLKWNLSESWLNEIISYINDNAPILEKNAKEIEELYASLNITEWIGVNFSEEMDKYITTLKNLLNKDGVQLISKDNILWENLWTSSCYKTVRKCSNEEKMQWCNDSEFPNRTCGFFSVIITWWKQLPISWNRTYYTTHDYQRELYFPVYQWNAEFEKGNEYIWEVLLKNLPSKLEWQASATVYFDVDEYWFLSVEAVDDSNWDNKAVKVELTPATNSVENKWDDYDKISNNIKYAIDETYDMINKISAYYSINPWDYVSENIWEIKDRIEHQTINLDYNNTENEVIEEKIIGSNINENIKVEKVIDWDTIRVTLNWQSVKVRLIWIEAPESNDTRYGYTECYGQASSNYLTNLLSNKTIWLEYDSTQWKYDKYDRILAYIFLNWENINKKMIENWYAWENTFNLPYKYQSEFKKTESNARQWNKWLWNKNTCGWEHKKWN